MTSTLRPREKYVRHDCFADTLASMRELVARNPVNSAIVIWLGLLLITHSSIAAEADVPERAWPGLALAGLVIYAVFAVWFTARKIKAINQPVFELLFALSAAPTIAGIGLGFQGAPAWSRWAALVASGGLLALSLRVSGQVHEWDAFGLRQQVKRSSTEGTSDPVGYRIPGATPPTVPFPGHPSFDGPVDPVQEEPPAVP